MPDRNPARYEEIAGYLRGLVAAASPGDRLPSDAELCARFGVSRMTARQAVQLVSAEGHLDRRRGAGTFVRSTPVPRDLGSPLSFTQTMRSRGLTASSRTLQWGVVTPTDDESAALGLAKEEKAYALERLRLADGTPMAIERVVMPTALALSLSDQFASGSLHQSFEEVGRIPTEAHAEVTARAATKRERELLGLAPTAVVICERRTIYDQEALPLERSETRYASTRYSFRAVLVRENRTRS